MLRDVLFVLGVLLSTASQLRLTGLNIGPGEACLALWLLVTLAREAMRLGPPLTPALSRLLAFWIVFAFALSLGTMAGFAIGDVHDPALFTHDIISYALAAAISCLAVTAPGAAGRMQRRSWLLILLGASWLALQVAHGWRLLELGDFEAWEWERFRGLSTDSNQLALLCLVLTALSLHCAQGAKQPGQKIAALFCALVALVVGRLTKSDAFLLALLVAGPIFFAVKLRVWTLSAERHLSLRAASAWLLALALPLMGAYAVPLGASLSAQAESAVREMTREGASGGTEKAASIRFHLWHEAIRRGIATAMLGLGPGPHLEVPPSMRAGLYARTQAKEDDRPQLGRVPIFEAHNTLLDLFVQGGIIATASFVWLVATTLGAAYRARLDALTTLIGGLAVFAMFHFVVRHPIVWFAIAFGLVAARENPSATVDARR